MNNGAGAALSARFDPRVTRLLALGWAAAIAFTWLFRYEAWVLPEQCLRLAFAALPALRAGPHFSEFWLARLADAGVIVAVLACAFGLGAIVIERLTGERNLLTGLFALALGLWVLGVGVLVIGVFSTGKTLWLVLALAGWLHPAPRKFFRFSGSERWDGWSNFLVGLIVLAAVLNLIGAMSPPFEYDELEYHLGAPTEYIKAGNITALPHNFYSDMPQLTEMLYLLTMTARSDIAAKMLHWTFGVLSAVGVYAVASRLWARRVGMTAAVLFYGMPYIQDLSQTARIDLATTFFATLAFGALLDERSVWLGAMMAGCAVATKWTAVAVVLLPAMGFVAFNCRSLRRPTVFGLLSLMFVLPWLIKNWLLTGNPVYPLLDGLFVSPHWSEAQAAMFAAKHAPRFDATGLGEFFERISRYSFSEIGAAPLLLMTVPVLVLFRGIGDRARRAVWLFAGAYLGWYLLTFRPWRFLLPALPLAAMAGAVGLEAAGKWCRIVAIAVILVGFTGMAANSLVDADDPGRLPAAVSFLTNALGQQSRNEFVSRLGHGVLEPVIWMNENLPATAKVLYVGEARTHHARHPVLWSTAFDQHPLDEVARKPVAPERLLARLQALGVTHVYVNFPEWQRLRVNYNYLLDIDNTALRVVLQEHARPVHVRKRGTVWELTR